jgi:hypothetical protein
MKNCQHDYRALFLMSERAKIENIQAASDSKRDCFIKNVEDPEDLSKE